MPAATAASPFPIWAAMVGAIPAEVVVAGGLPPWEPPVPEGEGAALVEEPAGPATWALAGSRVPHLARMSVWHLFCAIESPVFFALHSSNDF